MRGIEMGETPSKSNSGGTFSLSTEAEYVWQWLPEGAQQWSQWMGAGGKQSTVKNYHVEGIEPTDINIMPQL